MQPAADPTLSLETARAIAARHGLRADAPRLLRVGASVTVYLLGDGHVLRALRRVADDPATARTEVVAVRAAREAGVRAPRLVAFDEARDLLPVPYALYERVDGEALEALRLPPEATPRVWRDLGRDLALLHTRVRVDGPAGRLAALSTAPDPRPWLEDVAAEGYITPREARWLLGWLDRLVPIARASVREQFCHGDVNASNVMVKAGATGAPDYLALLDWDAAGWSDPAWDFSGVPLQAALLMLAGHRQVAPLPGDETAEARILWSRLQLGLFGLRQEGAGQRSRAISIGRRLVDGTRYFVEAAGLRELGPAEP
jgi:hygromycin-B 7''-O-kinase